MKILFITIGRVDSIYNKEIYPDLIRELLANGHSVTVLRFSEESDSQKKSGPVVIYNRHIHGIRGNVSSIVKGIAYHTFAIKAIKYVKNNPGYDFCVASTPPVTLSYVISYLKKKNIPTYLLQKDIFPEDAIDLGVLTTKGLKGVIYSYFRICENKLYRNCIAVGAGSDGCVNYLRMHNKNISASKFEVNPNSIIPSDSNLDATHRQMIRDEYNLPKDKTIFVYGGNISDAQGPLFIQKFLNKVKNSDAYFLFLGEGAGYDKLRAIFCDCKNMEFRKTLPSDEYYRIVSCSDVGLVFLSKDLTVPNVPSRMLFYMDNCLPILAAIDHVSDIYDIINKEQIGICCYSDEKDIDKMAEGVNKLLNENYRKVLGERSKEYLVKNWSCAVSVKAIGEHFKNKN